MAGYNPGRPYVRSCLSLITLQSEIQKTFPGREQNKGFVTGYKSPSNFSGHNPDWDGITFAYDIGVDIEGDGSGLLPRDAEWLANYLRTELNPRFAYLIYNRRIASNSTNFKWVAYTGASPHTDHIHISVADLYWGGRSGVSPSVFDSRASWGVYRAYHGTKPASGGVTPIKEKDWFDMADEQQLKEIVKNSEDRIKDLIDQRLGDVVDVPRNYGSKESRENNPKWFPQNVHTKTWHYSMEAAVNSAAIRALIEKMAEAQGFTLEDISETVEKAVKKVLEEGVLDVEIEVQGNSAV